MKTHLRTIPCPHCNESISLLVSDQVPKKYYIKVPEPRTNETVLQRLKELLHSDEYSTTEVIPMPSITLDYNLLYNTKLTANIIGKHMRLLGYGSAYNKRVSGKQTKVRDNITKQVQH